MHGQQLAPGATPVPHVYADNWGWYLFKYIPVITGNLNKPGVPQWPVLFTDNVRPDLLVDKVTQTNSQLGGTLTTDLRIRDRSYWIRVFPIFWLNEFEVSANVSRAPK